MNRKNKHSKHGQTFNLLLIAAALMILSIAPIAMISQASAVFGDEAPILVRNAVLSSPTGSINPHGAAEYQLYSSGNRELEVEIEDVNLSEGTILTAFIDGNAVGQMTLAADRRARLKLRSESGQSVPDANDGSTVQVRNGNTILVAGAFGGGGQTPSPTGNPSATPTPNNSPSPSPSPDSGDLFAGLTGATLNGALPRGFAQYELHSSRTELEVIVRQINLPGGRAIDVFVNDAPVGQVSVQGGEGRLRLRSDRGQTVPVISANSTISVKNGGATILSGRFSAFSGPSPTPTPAATPQATPTPFAGRYFESHLTGNQINPPVSTSARGEIKVFLNLSESVATVEGEFHNLSSLPTSVRIETQVGTTTVIRDLPFTTVNNGRVLTTAFVISPAQLSQLRSGLWFAVIATANNPNGEIGGRIIHHGNRSDFDGDGRNDLAVFRPSTETWFAQNSRGFAAETFGGADDRIVSGDYDGDGRTDAAVFKNVNDLGVWEIKRSSDGGVTTEQFGLATDIPLRGDFDGDGRNDLAVFRPSNGHWYVQNSNYSGYLIVPFGFGTDVPVPSDMDGDGRDDIVVFRPSEGNWYWLNSYNGQFGDIPIVGDFDGDAKQDLTVFRPSNGYWYIYRSSDSGFRAVPFGLGDDIPVAGDYDQDFKTDIAVFRPSNGMWYILRSTDGGFQAVPFGQNGDIPAIAR